MDEAVIDDLKQFIAATVSQHTADLATKDDIARLDSRIDSLDTKLTNRIDELQSSVSEAIDTGHSAVDAQLEDHERRLVKLEHKPV